MRFHHEPLKRPIGTDSKPDATDDPLLLSADDLVWTWKQVECAAPDQHSADKPATFESRLNRPHAFDDWAGPSRNELSDPSSTIHQTRLELGAARSDRRQNDQTIDAAAEIKAAIDEAFVAANTILSAAEQIDRATTLAASARSHSEWLGLHNDIRHNVSNIIASCNFQDLTGQRLRKVETLVSAMEARTDRMIAIWESASMLEPDTGVQEKTEAERLLNGPKLQNGTGHIDQDEIDQMFV